jgi:predicted transcriptional regulator of viral defense system
MQYEELLEASGGMPVVDTKTLRAAGEEPKALSVQLSRWVQAEKLIQLRRGTYLLPPHLWRQSISLEKLANLLVSPSYVSLERALSIHGHTRSAVPLVQSVTTERPLMLRTPVGDFQYRHVKRLWFGGYQKVPVGDDSILVAKPEKALLDLIYLSRGEFDRRRFEELGLLDSDRLDLGEVERIAAQAGKPRLLRAVKQLSDFLGSAERERQR